jgi:putative ABC transport system permease protein
MPWYTCLQLSLRALKRNHVRAILTTIGVIFGVGSVIAMLGVGSGSQKRVSEELEKMGTNNVVVRAGSPTRSGVRDWAGTATRLKVADAEAIRDLDGVIAVSPIARKLLHARYRGTNWATQVEGVTPEYVSIRRWELAEGDFFTHWHVERAAHVCVLGHTVARELFGFNDPLGEIIIVQGVACRVIGIMESKGASSWGRDQDDIIFMPVTTVLRKIIGKDYIRQILIETPDRNSALKIKDNIRDLMRARHRLEPYQDDDFRIHTRADLAEASEVSTRVFTWLLGSIASVSLLVGGIGIMNIMLVSVTERTREIGIRMALGARHRDVLAQFLFEALLLSCAGGLLGVFVGIGAATAIGNLSDLPVFITSWSIAVAFMFSVIVGIVFGLYPAQKAANLRPAEALRYE